MNDVLGMIEAGLLVAMLLPVNVFPVLYGLRSRWHMHEVGRALMTLSVGLALLVDVAVLYRVIAEDHPLRHGIVRVIVFAVIVVGLYWQTFALIRAQRLARRANGTTTRKET